ncbi:MAG: hypothetical protein U9Q37_08725 [Euryarchaeota archaeon]|nr:hypothetical protein [Euryarchaeota archaeon]
MKDVAMGLTIVTVSLVFLLSAGISSAEECVIITHPEFVGKCEELAEWKSNTGILYSPETFDFIYPSSPHGATK